MGAFVSPQLTKTGYVSHFDQAMFAANQHSTVFPQGPAGTTFPGDPGFPGKAAYFGHKADFAPRLGIVADPKGDGRMTIRAAYGIFYDLPTAFQDFDFSANPPFGQTVLQNNPVGGFANPWAGYPGGDPFATKAQSGSAVFPTGAAYLTAPLHVAPTYLQQWNVSIQKQIGADWLVSVNYLGNETVHLWSSLQINPAVYIPGTCSAGQYGLTAAGPCSSLSNIAQRRVLFLQNPAQGPIMPASACSTPEPPQAITGFWPAYSAGCPMAQPCWRTTPGLIALVTGRRGPHRRRKHYEPRKSGSGSR